MCLQKDAIDDAAEQLFLQLAEDTDDISFAITKSAELFTEYKVSEPHVVIFKKVRNINTSYCFTYVILSPLCHTHTHTTILLLFWN